MKLIKRPFKRPFFFSKSPNNNPSKKNKPNDNPINKLSFNLIEISCNAERREMIKDTTTPSIIIDKNDKLIFVNFLFIGHLN